MSFLTCFWLFPQKEHLSRSPAVTDACHGVDLLVAGQGRGATSDPVERFRRYPVRRPSCGPPNRGAATPVALTAERRPSRGRARGVAAAASVQVRTAVTACGGVRPGAEHLVDDPYSLASSAVRILSRSMSLRIVLDRRGRCGGRGCPPSPRASGGSRWPGSRCPSPGRRPRCRAGGSGSGCAAARAACPACRPRAARPRPRRPGRGRPSVCRGLTNCIVS